MAIKHQFILKFILMILFLKLIHTSKPKSNPTKTVKNISYHVSKEHSLRLTETKEMEVKTLTIDKTKIKIDSSFTEFINEARNKTVHNILEFKQNITNPKVSILIIVYNKEMFIEAAIKSVQMQTFKELEMIIVDDGSTDKTLEILEEAKKKDTRIKIYKHGINKGIFTTKLATIPHASGKYSLFLDSDDLFVRKDAIELTYNEIEKHQVEIVNFLILNGNPANLTILDNWKPKDDILYQPELKSYFFFPRVLFSKIYLTSLLKKLYDEFYDIRNTRMNMYDDFVLVHIFNTYVKASEDF